MGQTYTRQSAFSDGDTITASLFNNEFDQLVNAFNNSTGHTHDGTSGEGGPITVVGPNQDVSFGSTAVLPANSNTVNLGSATYQFKDGYFDGIVTLDGLVIGTSTSVTSVDTDLTSVSASDDTLASAKAIKTYVDAVATAADLDFQADTGGALSIDLDSETLTIAGTANEIETAGSGNTVTIGLPSNVTIGNNLTVTNNLITNNDVQFTGTAGNIIFDKSADTLGLQDDVYLAFGDDDDFKIYHNGTNTVLVDANATSTIVVANDLGVSITNAAGTTSSASFVPSGAATLNYAGSAKVATKTDGIDVTGEVQSDSLDVDGNADISGNLVVGGNVTIGDAGTDSVTVNAVIASDLVPYADGTYDLGSASLEWQDLYIDGTAHVDAINYDGTLITATAAELNILDGVTADATEINLLDGVTATTAEINRLDVTTVGALEANKVLTADASGNINFSSANMTNVDIDSGTIDGATINTSNITVPATKTLDVSAGTLTLANDQISGDKVEGGTIAAITITDLTTATVTTTGATTVGGNLTVTGDLTVNGTTTTINSTTLDVDDINITVAKGAADAAAANGAGLTVDGASATITYNSTGDEWAFNKTVVVADVETDTINEKTAAAGVTIDGVVLKDGGATVTADVNFGDNDKAIFGAGSDLQIYHDGSNSVIHDAGTGNLLVRAGSYRLNNADNSDNMIRAVDGGAVTLYNAGAAKLSTTSTGIDVTGTVTADGLQVQSTGNNLVSRLQPLSNSYTSTLLLSHSSAGDGGIQYYSGDNSFRMFSYGEMSFYASTSNISGSYPNGLRLRIAQNGDISFYDDTGTNASFVYDASTKLVVNEDSRDFDFRVESDASTHALFVEGSSGNLLVGKSTDAIATVGVGISGNLGVRATVDGNVGAIFNRLTSNGTIIDLRQDGATAGSIGIQSDGFYIDGESNHSGLRFGSGGIVPRFNGADIDADIGLGNETSRFQDLYLSGGVKSSGGDNIFNDGGGDNDFRVESDNRTHALFVQGSDGNVGMGISAPQTPLHITSDAYSGLRVQNGTRLDFSQDYAWASSIRANAVWDASQSRLEYATTGRGAVRLYMGHDSDVSGNQQGFIFSAAPQGTAGGAITFTELLRLNRLAGESVFNEGSDNLDFRVESDSNTHMLFVDGGSNKVSIGGSGTSRQLNNYITDSTTYNSTNFETNSLSFYMRNLDATVGAYTGIQFAVGTNSDCAIAGVRTADADAALVFGNRITGSGNTVERMRIDGGTGYVGIGKASPSYNLHVNGAVVAGTGQTIDPDAMPYGAGIGYIADGSGWGAAGIGFNSSSQVGDTAAIGLAGNTLYFALGDGTNADSFNSVCNIERSEFCINNNSIDMDFRVESDNSSYAFFVNGGTDNVGINSDGTVGRLSIYYNEGSTSHANPHLFLRNAGSGGTGDAGDKCLITTGFTASIGAGFTPVAFGGVNTDPSGNRDGAFAVYVADTDNVNFSTDERIRVAETGLLVGCTSTVTGESLAVQAGYGGAVATFNRTDNIDGNSRDMILFRRSTTGVGAITCSNTSTSYVTSSDYRLKTDVQPMTGATERLKALKPVNFEWISSGERVDGFLAHEAQEVVPEAVTGAKDAVDDEGNPVYQGIDQSKLVPLLVATIQELEARIAALETAS